MPSNNNMNARRPPSFEGWEVDLVTELNDVVDLYALSRDMPRLKVSSPSRHSVRNEAWTLNKDQKEEQDSQKEEANSSNESLGDKAFKQQLEEKADRMCAALLHLEELVNAATSSNSNAHSNAPDGGAHHGTAASSSSPLRTNSVKMYPKFAKDADLSSAFLSLLRETQWLPTEQEEVETSQSTGKSRGKIPCDKLLPQVRILGTMAQTVIFAPSRRIAHLMWHPDYSTNLMDCDWEVFLMDHPWPNSSRKKISKNRKNKKTATAPNEKSPLLSGNNNQINDDDENDDNNNEDEDLVTNHDHENDERPVTPSTQIQVRHGNTNDDDETNDENDQAKKNDSTDDNNQMIYVCHRIISRNVIAPENINRHPRFQIHWVLELQCGKVTGVMKRAKISGVRVRLMDDEAAVDAAASCGGCCSSCGAAAEWRDLRDELEERVERNFGVELERAKDADPF